MPKKPFEDSLAAACESAAKLLARREHSRRELEQKLRQRGYSGGIVDEALDELVQRDWLSDERYAAFIARHRCEQGRGPRWLRAELEAQGIDSEAQAAAFAQDELDWIGACRRALSRLSSAPEAKLRQKLFQRGFEAEQIQAALQARSANPDPD